MGSRSAHVPPPTIALIAPCLNGAAPNCTCLQAEYNNIAKFLEAKGMPEQALEVATDAGGSGLWVFE
jgi:hypothetical protein